MRTGIWHSAVFRNVSLRTTTEGPKAGILFADSPIWHRLDRDEPLPRATGNIAPDLIFDWLGESHIKRTPAEYMEIASRVHSSAVNALFTGGRHTGAVLLLGAR